jgi:hypothetical protein
MSENAPGRDVIAADAGPQEGYWLPEIVHVHLTAIEAGWLIARLHDREHSGDVGVMVRGPSGEAVLSTMSRVICDKVRKAWEAHD